MCWPGPKTASGWDARKPGITTCRTKDAPDWPSAPAPPFRLPLWPAPRGTVSTASPNAKTAHFAKGFEVHCNGAGCPSAATLMWYQQRISTSAATSAIVRARRNSSTGRSVGIVYVATVHIRSATRDLTPSMNESYTLKCADESCTVTATETVGALRGLETLAHLAHAGSLPLPLTVSDSPRYPYRGLLLDSARHFLPLQTIKRMLDGMSLTKLNALHWHLSDTTSFPVVSKRYPALSANGAFDRSLV
jgi:hypothetical protein